MSTRKQPSKSVRFEVFKRDSFSCQYCGESAPKVLLHVDHIEPVAKGGSNDITNLITACQSCNLGKSDKRLDDSSALDKSHAQLAVLQDRREQLEMMKQWRDMCVNVADEEVDLVETIVSEEFNCVLNDQGRKSIKKLIKTYGLGRVLDCTQKACEHYEMADQALSKIKTFIQSDIANEELPGSGKIPYIIAILRNRNVYCNGAATEIKEFLKRGGSIENAIESAKQCRSWTRFKESLYPEKPQRIYKLDERHREANRGDF